MQYGFYKSTIASGFVKVGIYPANLLHVFCVPWPRSFSRPNEFISAEDIEKILEDRREKRRNNIGLQPVVLRNEFLDTTFGFCLTSKEALKSQGEGCCGQRQKSRVSK